MSSSFRRFRVKSWFWYVLWKNRRGAVAFSDFLLEWKEKKYSLYLKITQKVAFYNIRTVHIWPLESGAINRNQNCENQNETFWVIFKDCERGEILTRILAKEKEGYRVTHTPGIAVAAARKVKSFLTQDLFSLNHCGISWMKLQLFGTHTKQKKSGRKLNMIIRTQRDFCNKVLGELMSVRRHSKAL